MKDSGEEHSSKRGFFHTMVVMGGALALGCGGESRAVQEAPDGVAGMNTDGAGGKAGNGGTASSAAGTGALAGSGGSGVGGTGGVISIGGNGGSSGMAALPDCPTTQWTCQYGGCDGYVLSSGSCTCDLTRPKTVADCAAGDSMVCVDGTEYNASGNATTQHLPYQCQCLPRQPDCTTACQIAAADARLTRCLNADPTAAPDPTEPILCGCAPIVLK